MKINLIKKIENIDSILDPERGIISFSNKIIMNDNIIFNGDIYFITLFKNSLMITIGNGESSYFMNLKNLESKFFSEIGVIDFFLDDETVLYGFWNGDYSKREIKSIDLKLNKVLWKKDYSIGKIYMNDNSFYAIVDKNISQIEKQTGNYLWKFSNLSDFNWIQKNIYEGEPKEERQAEVEKFIGTYKDILWVVLNSGRLLGLDVSSGELKHNLEKPINYNEENTLFLPAITGTIDTEKGIMFGLKYTSYFEINLESPETSYLNYDISETCRTNSIEADYPSNDLSWEGDEIFIGKNELHYEKYPCYVGVFNRNSKEIIWSSKELGDIGNFNGISKIDYSTNKLYVLDRENTLHIFERE